MKKLIIVCSAACCLAAHAQFDMVQEQQRCTNAIAMDADLLGLVLFPAGDTTPSARDRAMLAALLAEVNRRDPERKKTVLTIGHADQPGGDELNMRLSLERSKAVSAEFLKQDPTRTAILQVGCGQSQLLLPQTAEGGHPHNRRVEVRLVP
jgi:outer membrane protein OmpA-like peptidoglycan-associated protein